MSQSIIVSIAYEGDSSSFDGRLKTALTNAGWTHNTFVLQQGVQARKQAGLTDSLTEQYGLLNLIVDGCFVPSEGVKVISSMNFVESTWLPS